MVTKINLRFGATVVAAELNDTDTARSFAEKLPTTIHVGGTGIDFCGQETQDQRLTPLIFSCHECLSA